VKVTMQNAGRTRIGVDAPPPPIPGDTEHAPGGTHEAKHILRAERRAVERQVVRKIKKTKVRAKVRSEWLDRSPGANIATIKRGGAKFGQAPRVKAASE
jgi:hypothetical protein